MKHHNLKSGTIKLKTISNKLNEGVPNQLDDQTENDLWADIEITPEMIKKKIWEIFKETKFNSEISPYINEKDSVENPINVSGIDWTNNAPITARISIIEINRNRFCDIDNIDFEHLWNEYRYNISYFVQGKHMFDDSYGINYNNANDYQLPDNIDNLDEKTSLNLYTNLNRKLEFLKSNKSESLYRRVHNVLLESIEDQIDNTNSIDTINVPDNMLEEMIDDVIELLKEKTTHTLESITPHTKLDSFTKYLIKEKSTFEPIFLGKFKENEIFKNRQDDERVKELWLSGLGFYDYLSFKEDEFSSNQEIYEKQLCPIFSFGIYATKAKYFCEQKISICSNYGYRDEADYNKYINENIIPAYFKDLELGWKIKILREILGKNDVNENVLVEDVGDQLEDQTEDSVSDGTTEIAIRPNLKQVAFDYYNTFKSETIYSLARNVPCQEMSSYGYPYIISAITLTFDNDEKSAKNILLKLNYVSKDNPFSIIEWKQCKKLGLPESTDELSLKQCEILTTKIQQKTKELVSDIYKLFDDDLLKESIEDQIENASIDTPEDFITPEYLKKYLHSYEEKYISNDSFTKRIFDFSLVLPHTCEKSSMEQQYDNFLWDADIELYNNKNEKCRLLNIFYEPNAFDDDDFHFIYAKKNKWDTKDYPDLWRGVCWAGNTKDEGLPQTQNDLSTSQCLKIMKAFKEHERKMIQNESLRKRGNRKVLLESVENQIDNTAPDAITDTANNSILNLTLDKEKFLPIVKKILMEKGLKNKSSLKSPFFYLENPDRPDAGDDIYVYFKISKNFNIRMKLFTYTDKSYAPSTGCCYISLEYGIGERSDSRIYWGSKDNRWHFSSMNDFYAFDSTSLENLYNLLDSFFKKLPLEIENRRINPEILDILDNQHNDYYFNSKVKNIEKYPKLKDRHYSNLMKENYEKLIEASILRAFDMLPMK